MAFVGLILSFLCTGILLSIGVFAFWQSTHRLMLAIGAIALVSAYSSALVANLGAGFLLAALCGLASGCILGSSIALVAHRLAESEFLLLALAVGELARRGVLEARGVTGGAYGLRVSLGRALPGAYPAILISLLIVLTLLVTQWWLGTPTGLRWRLVGEARYAAVLAGVNPRKVEFWSGLVAGFAAALAAVLHISVFRYVSPDDFAIGTGLSAAAVGLAARPRWMTRDILALCTVLFASRELLRLLGGTGVWRFAVHDLLVGGVVLIIAVRLGSDDAL